MHDSLERFLSRKLSERSGQGLLRTLNTSRLSVDFFSNDYLGLARSEELYLAVQDLQRLHGIGNGSTGSRLLSGNSPLAEDLERNLSRTFQSEATLLFNSGYAANLAVLSSIPQKGDTILYDSLAHASLKDGARLSLAARHSFRHNDMTDLERKLRSSGGRKFIVAESIYSMDGDECALSDIVALAEKYDAAVILDEAHSTGVRGPLGSGISVEYGLHDRIAIRIYTFGKGMGVHGACVAGSDILIRYLINFARPFIYTTALPQHDVISIHCAFQYVATHMHLQEILKDRIKHYLDRAGAISNRTTSQSAIQTVIVPGNDRIREISVKLRNEGFDVRPILSPTVPAGTERLRICLHTFNSPEDIDALTRAMAKIL